MTRLACVFVLVSTLLLVGYAYGKGVSSIDGKVCPVFAEKCARNQKVRGCASDKSCASGKLCCRVSCGRSRCIKPVCPVLEQFQCLVAGTLACKSERNCGKGSHCCISSNCGDSKCTEDSPSNSCPAIKEGEFGSCAITCTAQQPCGKGLLCCNTACGGTYCYDPTLTR